MSEKYLVVGATGSIGSNLAEQLHVAGKEVHLVGRDEERTKSLSEKLNCKYTVSDVLENGFVEKKGDISLTIVESLAANECYLSCQRCPFYCLESRENGHPLPA